MRVLPQWRIYFGESVSLVKQCRGADGWAGPLGQLNEVCQLGYALLRHIVTGNNRCAEQLQSLDAVEKLLKQLPTGWAPPVVEVFDALMRSDSAGSEVNKSDIRNMMDMIDDELHKVDGVAPAMLLDFLSSVCRTGKQGHEKMQNGIAQLLCGLISEGTDPHFSSLIYQLRLIAAPEQGGATHRPPPPLPGVGAEAMAPTSAERLRVVEVQISSNQKGKTRPPYTADGEEGETDLTYEQRPDDVIVGDEDEAVVEVAAPSPSTR